MLLCPLLLACTPFLISKKLAPNFWPYITELLLRPRNEFATIERMGTEQNRAISLGRLIRRYRENAQLSINELARRIDLSPSIISRVESGEHAHPRAETLVRIASGLGVSAAELFAAAGYATPHDLPPFRAYMKTRYANLPAQAQQELTQHFRRLQRRYGPRDREDE